MASALLPWLADGLALLGAVTTGVAIYGLIRLPDVYTRIHAASKVAVLGVIPILIASLSTGDPSLILRAVLIVALLVLTTPVASHAIARAAYLEGTPASSANRERSSTSTCAESGNPGTEGLSANPGSQSNLPARRDDDARSSTRTQS